jgi:hypothetical protein
VIEGEGSVRLRARNKHNNKTTLSFIGIPFVSDWTEGPLRDNTKNIMVYFQKFVK